MDQVFPVLHSVGNQKNHWVMERLRNESKAGARSGSRAQTLLARASLYMWEKGSGVLSNFSCHSSPI